MGYIKHIQSNPNAYCFLMGDLINCANIGSKSSVFKQDMDLNDQIKECVKLLNPIKHKILGAITGNHEQRLEHYTGYNTTISICDKLGIHYFGYSGLVIFRLGCHSGKGKNPRGSFTGYFHHTTGGGGTIGGKINRPSKLREVVTNCDFYCGAHNHLLSCAHTIIKKVNETTEVIEDLRQMVVTTGGYLQFDNSYVEEKMLPPLKIGSPRIHIFVKQGTNGQKNTNSHL